MPYCLIEECSRSEGSLPHADVPLDHLLGGPDAEQGNRICEEGLLPTG